MTEADADLYRDYADRGGSAVAVGAGQQLSECEMLVGMLLPSANNLADTLAVWGIRIARRIPDGGNAAGPFARHDVDDGGYRRERLLVVDDQHRAGPDP